MKNLMFIFILLTSTCSWATVSCVPYNLQTMTLPLNVPIVSAGTDMPNGTIFYTTRFNNTQGTLNPFARCTTTVLNENYQSSNGIKIAPNGQLSSFSGGPFPGAVYDTNIPGVGVVVTRNKNDTPITSAIPYQVTSSGRASYASFSQAYPTLDAYISLIKTGDIPPGSYQLNSSSLPTIYFFFDNADGQVPIYPERINAITVNFSGSMTISNRTCITPDVHVEMGSHNIQSAFNGLGSVTGWVNASIKLINCPVFYGYYNNAGISSGTASNTIPYIHSAFNPAIPATLNNNLGIRLAPSTNIINASSGIMEIKSTPNSASGVGIQLGWGTPSPTPINFANEIPFKLEKDGANSINLPLYARYIQTQSTMSPGRADGVATFTINYY